MCPLEVRGEVHHEETLSYSVSHFDTVQRVTNRQTAKTIVASTALCYANALWKPKQILAYLFHTGGT